MNKIPIIVIAGPTASGKTAVSIRLAKELDGEIVSADSMQIYKGLDIATAKPTKEEMQGIPHHLMSFVDNSEKFSVAQYLEKAREVIADIHQRGKMPIVVGGTGLYISSLVDNIIFDEISSDGEVRARLTKEAEEIGNEAMLQKLMEIDEETAKTLHPNNLTRIIRALEAYELSGLTMSELKRRSREEESPYNACMIGLNFHDRQKLYDRINLRVDKMAKEGMVEEAFEFYKNERGNTVCQAIGYKELIPYFEGKATLDECLETLKRETRRYAKRQLTWFRRDERIHWIYLDETVGEKNIIDKCKKYIAKCF
ncbi:MAG: tRNA (adenosine(37)-N6)-dimethylallyltransferase MiaA [Oscillospiraceae bacterium]